MGFDNELSLFRRRLVFKGGDGMKHKIICRGCVEEMEEMEDKSVDLVFYDPPYNRKKKYGKFKDNLSEEEYLIFQSHVITEAQRISRNGVTIFLSQGRLHDFWDMIPNARVIVVHKRAAGKRWNKILVQWHPILTTSLPSKQLKGQHITDFWEVRLPGEGYFFREKRTGNPGQTSMALTEKVIKSFSEEGDIIYDPFLGCGTTSLAAEHLKRNSIGSDISKEYSNFTFNALKSEIVEQTKLTGEQAIIEKIGF